MMSSIPRPLKGIVTDVDGTLYRQHYVRMCVVAQLFAAHVTKPVPGWKALRAIRAYRKAQEHLRNSGRFGDLAGAQMELACRSVGCDPETMRSYVGQWMEIEPLRFLPKAVYPGLAEFLSRASQRGVRLGLFSDYDASAKLEAMGLAHFFQVVVKASDPDVQQFKPGTRGLEVTLKRLAVKAREAIYVGDRPDVDAVAASRAGMSCVILGRSPASDKASWINVRSYPQLNRMVFG